jgi:hypothetical protein
MKKLLLILLVSCSFLNSQELTDEQIVKLASALKQQTELIAAYETQISNYKEKVTADSVVISNQGILMVGLEEQVENYKKYSKNVKPAWYENKWLYYSYGVLTVVGNIWLYDKVK